MSLEAAAAPAARRWTMWNIVLVVSLALNLLAAGFFAADLLWPGRAERISGTGFTQLVPRNFLKDLPADRRKELIALLKTSGPAFREGRQALRDAALKLAASLEAEPYDAAASKAAVDDFARAGTGMLAEGGRIANELLGRLTPAERLLFAKRLRERAERRR